MKKNIYFIAILASLLLKMTSSFAQDKVAKLSIKFEKVDTNNVCNVSATSEGLPVKGVSINLFVKRMLRDLPIASVATEENGIASFVFPKDIPSIDGNLTLIAKITDDDNYKNTEERGDINWGTLVVSDNCNVNERAISAARDKAPIYLIATSIFIISIVWGTLLWAVLQVFKIKKVRNNGR